MTDDDDDFKMPSESQREEGLSRCLCAAHKVLLDSLGVQDRDFCLNETTTWDAFRTAMDNAEKAVGLAEREFTQQEGLDYIGVDTVHICASALHALVTHLDPPEDIVPYSVVTLHMLAFGRWMVVREGRLALAMAEEDGAECLGGESSIVDDP